ncbi:MAG: hypothetical protein AAFY77_08735 [Pseudomonadota bacterium]
MSFVRPEVVATLRRWRETLAGLGALTLGSYWLVFGVGPIWILGAGLVAAGALLAIAGIQRARFRTGGGGAGVVRIVEGQLSYFGPFDGGVLAIENVTAVALRQKTWILSHEDGNPVEIPTTAEGAEALFDVFANLPGLRTQDVLDALNAPEMGYRVLWEKRPARLH